MATYPSLYFVPSLCTARFLQNSLFNVIKASGPIYIHSIHKYLYKWIQMTTLKKKKCHINKVSCIAGVSTLLNTTLICSSVFLTYIKQSLLQLINHSVKYFFFLFYQISDIQYNDGIRLLFYSVYIKCKFSLIMEYFYICLCYILYLRLLI